VSLRRRLARIAIVLLLAAGLGLCWLLYTTAGARFVLARALAAGGGQVTVGTVSGSLGGTLVLGEVKASAGGIDATMASVRIRAAPSRLLLGRVLVHELVIEHLRASRTPGEAPPAAQAAADDTPLSAPWPIELERVAFSDAQWRDRAAEPVQVDALEFGMAWRGTELNLHKATLRVPDGDVALDARCDTALWTCATLDSRFSLPLSGQRYTGTLRMAGSAGTAHATLALSAPTAVTLDATLKDGERRAWTAHLVVPTFDPRPLAGGTRLSSLSLDLEAQGDREGGAVLGALSLNGHALTLPSLHYTVKPGLLTLTDLSVRTATGPAEFDASGTIALKGEQPDADLALAWKHVELPEDLVGLSLTSTGRIALRGSPERYRVDGNLSVARDARAVQVQLGLSGDAERIAIETLSLAQAQGRIEASGEVVLDPDLGWNLRLRAQRADPSDWWPDWPGAIDLDATLAGTRTEAGTSATLALKQLGGSLRGRPLRGSGQVALSNGMEVSGRLELASGRNVLRITGDGGSSPRLAATLDFADLSGLSPDLRGRIAGTLSGTGRWPRVGLSGNLRGEGLATPHGRAATLDLDLALSDLLEPAGRAAVTLADAEYGTARYTRMQLDFEGTGARHVLRLAASGSPAAVDATLVGGRAGTGWRGQLESLTLATPKLAAWELVHPVELVADAQVFDARDLCLQQGGGRLCVDLAWRGQSESSVQYRASEVPIALFAALAGAPPDLAVTGQLAGEGRFTFAPGGDPRGEGRIEIPQLVIEQGGRAKPLRLALGPVVANARWQPDGAHLELHATVQDDGRLDVDARMDPRTQALSGRVLVSMPDLAFLNALDARVANVRGALSSDLALGGTRDAPEIGGSARLTGLGAELPGAGITLSDGALALTFPDARSLSVQGQVRSGAGVLKVHGSGSLSREEPLSIQLEGSDFTVLDTPTTRVVASPALTLTRTADGYRLGGELGIPKARIDTERLPGGPTLRRSGDVVVLDRPAAPAADAALPFEAEVDVLLGDDVKIVGYGLDGSVSGRLTVRDRPGQVTTGRGSLTLAGSYRAYGQNLTIERGRLLFAATALDNPGLDLRAARTIGEVQAGVAVSGRANAPVLSVYSVPPMAQGDALSYLVTGRPLNALKGSEGAMVNGAARAMGTAAGDVLARSVGARMGVDASVSENATLGGAAFSVGKYLSPRLFISYGVGLFTPGEVVTLRYLLSRRWNLEVENASRASRAGVNYRYEKR